MTRLATNDNVTTLQNSLQPYVDAITNAVIQAMAQLRLNIYLDAVSAFMNVSASAAASYSTSVGGSTQKRRVDEARGAMDTAWAAFVEIAESGGQTVPMLSSGASYWDLSGMGM